MHSSLVDFDTDNHVWNLLSKDEQVVKLVDNDVQSVLDYLKSTAVDFTGTATKLSEEVETVTGKKISQAQLKKKLMKNHGALSDKGFAFGSRRTHDEKIIEIARVASARSAELVQ